MKKLFGSVLAAACLGILRAWGGGAVPIEWGNDGVIDGTASPLCSDFAGTRLSAGLTNVAGDGALLQLVAIQGGTNYVLVTASIGDAPNAVAVSGEPFAGSFQLASVVPSNVLAGAIGAPMGVRFYNATSAAAATLFGVVSNESVRVPTPNWEFPPFPVTVVPDAQNPSWKGARTQSGTGFYTDTPTGHTPTNQPPNARCRDVQVVAGSGCTATVLPAQVDDGSSDPDGDAITLSLNPAGPFALGSNSVELIVADTRGATSVCSSVIVVVDVTPPAVVCPGNITVTAAEGATGAVVNYPTPTASDNCGVASLTSVPASGSFFPLGVTVVTAVAVDTSGNSNSCAFTVTVQPLVAPPPSPSGQLNELQGGVDDVWVCLGSAAAQLLAGNRGAATVEMAGCVTRAQALLASAQSSNTVAALGAKNAGKLQKTFAKLLALIQRGQATLADGAVDDARAAKALAKILGAAGKTKRGFLKYGAITPLLVLQEVKGKTGIHGTNTVVCYQATLLAGAATNCAPLVVSIEELPGFAGLEIVRGPRVLTNQPSFCVTTGADFGAAVLEATACATTSRVVLINTGQ